MAFSPSTPVTGGPALGLTSPTYTIALDIAPSPWGKQYLVNALGGTQTGVTVHSVSRPFTTTFFRPQVLRPAVLFVNGVPRGGNPRNIYKHVTRHCGIPAPGAAPSIITATTIYEIDAGVETNDTANVSALVSLHHGVAWAQSLGISTTLFDGALT